jgi:hypothetical protein
MLKTATGNAEDTGSIGSGDGIGIRVPKSAR